MISLILAIDPKGLIGKNNDLPWHYPEDLKYFKETTLNKTVLMGTKTFVSILNRLKKPLPNRKSLVASKSNYAYPGVETINSLTDFLAKDHQEEIFIIGGKTIYEAAFAYADRLYITHIHKEYEGDSYLQLDMSNFSLIKEDIRDGLTFAIYERII